MYNMSTRMNQIAFFTGMVLLICSALNIAIGQFMMKGDATVSFSVNKIRKLTTNTMRQWDECWLNFQISADLTEYLDWNAKYAYLYVNVEFYDQDKKFKSQNTIWDQHIQRKLEPTFFDASLGHLYTKVNLPHNEVSLKDQRHKYALRDVYNSLIGQEVTFQVWVEITPIIGNIYKEKLFETLYQLPNQKIA